MSDLERRSKGDVVEWLKDLRQGHRLPRRDPHRRLAGHQAAAAAASCTWCSGPVVAAAALASCELLDLLRRSRFSSREEPC